MDPAVRQLWFSTDNPEETIVLTQTPPLIVASQYVEIILTAPVTWSAQLFIFSSSGTFNLKRSCLEASV
jgi:hypothetical protein